MKKILYVVVALSAVGMILLNMASAKGKEELDLFKMAEVLEGEKIDINKWTLHARKSLENVQAQEKMKELSSEYSDMNWEISEDNEKWHAKAVMSEDNGINETLQILSTGEGNQMQSYLIYEITGEGWQKETKEFIEQVIVEKLSDIFHGKAIIFSCIFSEFGDKMNKSLPSHVNELLRAFEANEIETLEEDSFISTTAYTKLFSESFKGQSEEMNLQLGVRNQGLGGKTTLVVGTPIITVEY
ncbi:YwmB family TATA-box binding protein [Bacillus tuaregi]|uniref:YwmB family TATA-box binding protein n=1 Tax=Bacillus tuaregi TaxID=1816695 RepID=UPI0008F8838E|nr:YwmB family TATA-box binding protein [Bacillus tuaregi]